ncbi:MAG TPA: o-succinylbenzoate synthase [Chondromyces sp.]|nr:o-succinylbenzoate synthase [Chondromyces sp.]
MKIERLYLHVIEMDLKKPFVTHLETVRKRRGILIEAEDSNGVRGFGEAVAFTTPWYTEETVTSCYYMIKDVLFPLLVSKEWNHPSEIAAIFEPVRGNPMAKAAIETAAWDLFSKFCERPLSAVIGGGRAEVYAGAVAAASSINEALKQIDQFVEDGYRRVKVKISPGQDIEWLKEIRRLFPDIMLMADANSAYTLEDMDRLKALDEFQLTMIEQPLAFDDLVEHAILQKELQTPICLDESIRSARDVENAIRLGSCGVINIKMGRVGGLGEAIKIHDLCVSNGIKVWAGGMIEFGISKAHNVALASLEGFSIPGDLSSSSRYWEKDIIDPEIKVIDGKIPVPHAPGIGFALDEERLQKVTVYKERLEA